MTPSQSLGDRYAAFRGAVKNLDPTLSTNHDRSMKSAKPTKKAPVRKPVPARRAPSAIVRPSIAETLEVALTKTTEAGSLFAERLVDLRVNPEILQEDLASILTFGRIVKVAEAPEKSFDVFVKSVYAQREQEAGEGEKVRLDVEVGTRVLSWEDNRRVTPAWKDQAIRHAQILHAVANAFVANDREAMGTLLAPFMGSFDAKVWEEAIRRVTPKTGSLTPKIVEG